MLFLHFRQRLPNGFSTCPLLLQFSFEGVGWGPFPLWQLVIRFSGNKTLDLPDRGAPSTFDSSLTFPLLISPPPHPPPQAHTHTVYITCSFLSKQMPSAVLQWIKPTPSSYLLPQGFSEPGNP